MIYTTVQPRKGMTQVAPNEPRYLLLNLPFTDPTAPYHSIPYLVGSTAQAGFRHHSAVDVNLDLLEFMAQPSVVRTLLDTAARVRRRAEGSARVSRRDQLRYRYALPADVSMRPNDVVDAITTYQTPEDFYDYAKYRKATLTLKRWVGLFNLEGPVGLFDSGFKLRLKGPLDVASIDELVDPVLQEELLLPFAGYFAGPFTDLVTSRRWDLIGLSVNYVSQLPFAVALCRRLRELAGEHVTLVLGGTEISDEVKYLKQPSDIWKLYPDADAIVPGEGEQALTSILAALSTERPLDQASLTGTMLRDVAPRSPSSLPIVYESVNSNPGPAYEVWDWNRYWSPEAVILYSPTRGCYWNKCTFCDYGLNTDRPTTPSRERDVGRIIADLQRARTIGRTFYFAVDAMSPKLLRRLCEAIAEEDLGIRWSAELRLERAFPKAKLGDALREGGCVAVSFGYESGSQRILDLIDKGVRLGDVPQVLSSLRAAGIGVQMMGFTGFPSETPDEAAATYEFLLDHRDGWALAGIGEFVLTPGSIVARRPNEFGVTVPHDQGGDIVRSLRWYAADTASQRPALESGQGNLDQHIMSVVDDRPYVGGIDSAHSILYFARNGRHLLPQHDRPPHGREEEVVNAAAGILDEFVSLSDLEAQHVGLRNSVANGGQAVRAWLNETEPVNTTLTEVSVLASGEVLPAPWPARGDAHHQLRRRLLLAHGHV